jgi:8-hydroxy-5-deazaflavin:NADPH oxidoreductase
MTDNLLLTIAIIGGTGKEGSGLALRLVRSGYRVVIGSRSAEWAKQRSEELNGVLKESGLIQGTDNLSAAQQADLVVLTVPYSAQRDILDGIRPALTGKILVSVVVPVRSERPTQSLAPESGSAALEAQMQLGPDVRVVIAFQNVSATLLADPDQSVDCDVLVCGDDAEAKVAAMRLAEAAGMIAYDAGSLRNSGVVEGFTSILLGINKRYHSPHAGIHITGVTR